MAADSQDKEYPTMVRLSSGTKTKVSTLVKSQHSAVEHDGRRQTERSLVDSLKATSSSLNTEHDFFFLQSH